MILHTAGQPPELPPKGGGMWPYPWTHVGTPSHLGHMDRVAATMPSQAHAGAAQEATDIGQWEGQDVPLVRPSSCKVKGGIPSSRRYLSTYLPTWKNEGRINANAKRQHLNPSNDGLECFGKHIPDQNPVVHQMHVFINFAVIS